MTTANVVVLRPFERLQDGCDELDGMCTDIGVEKARHLMARAAGEVALMLATLADQVRRHELADMAWQLRRLQRLAEGVGMMRLGQVAGDLRACLQAADVTGFAAVWARLLRVAERSLDDV
jgi:hypothetical protein